MTSMYSDTESNGMESITQDILQIEKNMQNIVQKCAPMESHLAALLQSFPRPDVNLPNPMETE